MSDSHYDLAIVGAGGYVSAIRAAHHGLRVALVDPNPLGGVCLHTGCIPIRMGRFPFAAIGKALAQGETDGFVKLIAYAETGQLLGGHILGGHAAELIGQITLAIKLKATAEQLTETIFAHPTLSEAILEAAESLFGQSTHLPKPRKRK